MKIKQVSYGKTINIGNYQSIRVEFTCELAPDETASDGLEYVREHVRQAEVVVLRENKK